MVHRRCFLGFDTCFLLDKQESRERMGLQRHSFSGSEKHVAEVGFASKPVANAITIFRNGQSTRKMSWIEFIGSLLTDNIHGGKMFHCSGYQ